MHMIRKLIFSRRLSVPIMAGAIFSIAASGSARAGLVVNWGGNYVSNSQLFNDSDSLNTGPADDYGDPVGPLTYNIDTLSRSGTVAGRQVSSSTLYNPAIGPSYNGSNAKFYGGHSVVYSAPPNRGLTNLMVENQGMNDAIHVEAKPDADIQRFAMLTYWDSADFIGAPALYSVNGTSVFSLNSTQDSNTKTPLVHSLRWVIRNVGQFYLSTPLSFENNGTYTSAILPLTNWTAYNPMAAPSAGRTILDNVFLSNSAGGVSTPNFDNVTAIGFYIEFLRPVGVNGAISIDYKINNFNATLDPPIGAVPEPSTFALGLVGLSGAALRRWRKRRGAKTQGAPENAGVELSSEISS